MDSSAQKRKPDLTQDSFDWLLAWLDNDREQAGEKYEKIRSQLVRIFTWRGCLTPEELADETINRVAKKIPEISAGYVGDPALYFYGVAQKVHLEYSRRRPDPTPLHKYPAGVEEAEPRYDCLEQCMNRLSPENLDLIIDYYADDKLKKKERRRETADRLGIRPNALWIRAHRIRESLKRCVTECLARTRVQ